MKTVQTEKEAAAAEARRQIRKQQELDDMAALLGTAYGRRFIYRLLERGQVFSPILSGDTSSLIANATRHDFCLKYLSQVLTVKPDALQVMTEEASKESNV